MPSALLRDRCILRVSGADARHFLHNILTNTIEDLHPGVSCYAALLTPQGKILSDLFVQCTGADSFLLDAPLERGDTLLKRLTLYKLRAAVTIENVSESYEAVLVWEESLEEEGEMDFFKNSGDFIPDPRLDALGGRWVRPREETASVDRFLDSGLDDYHAHRVGLCIPEGGVDFLYEETFPHEACLDQLNGIDFQKGCYVGQEIVSRMQHRGTARTRIVQLECPEGFPETGTPITASGKTLGRLGSNNGQQGIGLIRLDRAAECLAAKIPVKAGEATVYISLPAWAHYDWPTVEAS